MPQHFSPHEVLKVPRQQHFEPSSEADINIARKLTEAQADMAAASEILARRRRAVMAAVEFGMSKYKIAAVLGVKGPTVDSIIKSAEREREQEKQR